MGSRSGLRTNTTSRPPTPRVFWKFSTATEKKLLASTLVKCRTQEVLPSVMLMSCVKLLRKVQASSHPLTLTIKPLLANIWRNQKFHSTPGFAFWLFGKLKDPEVFHIIKGGVCSEMDNMQLHDFTTGCPPRKTCPFEFNSTALFCPKFWGNNCSCVHCSSFHTKADLGVG